LGKIDSEHISTSYLGRQNPWGWSIHKGQEDREPTRYAFAVFYMHYNFCGIHESAQSEQKPR
jgi:hypothetical protein